MPCVATASDSRSSPPACCRWRSATSSSSRVALQAYSLYYNAGMTLTVRLPEPLDHALEDYCAAHGLSKSQVVQESLADYLVRRADVSTAGTENAGVSANY